MSLDIKQIDYKNFGRCISLSNGLIEVIVTIDVGPRIISFSYANGNNVLFTDESRVYQKSDSKLIDYWGEKSIFYDYGGHRLCILPKSWPETFCPDNEPVIYSSITDGIRLSLPAQTLKDVYMDIEITIKDNAEDIMIIHNLKNNSNEKKIIALSGITQLRAGGLLIVPQNKIQDENEINPNKSFAFWSYSKFNDKRVSFERKYITLKQDINESRRFKFGFNNCSNWAAYKTEKCMFVKNYIHNKRARYPDFNSSFEAYVDADMLEISSLSPLYSVETGEAMRHVENWLLYRCNNSKMPCNTEEIEMLIEKI